MISINICALSVAPAGSATKNDVFFMILALLVLVTIALWIVYLAPFPQWRARIRIAPLERQRMLTIYLNRCRRAHHDTRIASEQTLAPYRRYRTYLQGHIDVQDVKGDPSILRLVHSGDTLNARYRILEKVASTGYDVFHAYDTWTGAEVAIKRLAAFPSSGAIPEGILRLCLEREAAILRCLPPGIAPRYIGMFYEGGALTLVTEWITGRTVRALIDERSLSAEQALAVAIRLCDALVQLHAFEPALLHKDIKPENLVVCEDGRVVLIDFGIAEWLGEPLPIADVLGTPWYASPEQCRGELLDCRADVYAAGRVIGELAEAASLTLLSSVLEQATNPDAAARLARITDLRVYLYLARFLSEPR